MSDCESKELFEKYIDEHTEELLHDVLMLCRIPSVKGPQSDGAPYGAAAKEALIAAGELMRKYGLTVRVYEDRVISGDLNDAPRTLDILAHLDVVAPGEGWTVTKPFDPVVKDEAIFGRGTSDDKGPAVAALYAMRAVRELGIPLSKGCRLVLGTDEECGSSDLPCYLSSEKEAPMTFTPDSEFPVTNVEKGHFRGRVSFNYLSASSAGHSIGAGKLISFKSGDTINIVPGKAEAVICRFGESDVLSAAEKVKTDTGAEFIIDVSRDEGNLRLNVSGKSAHASTPEKGLNAGVIMLLILSELKFADDGLNKALSELKKLFPFGDHRGAAIGADYRDDIAGETSVSPDIFSFDEENLIIRFDARTSLSFEKEKGSEAVKALISGSGFDFDYVFGPAHVVSEDSDFVTTLTAMYELVTGREGHCKAIGGGTYVHNFKNGVAFGAVGCDTDTHMHGADEFMPVSELKDASVIYALCIAKLLK